MAEHTPGPWKVAPDSGGYLTYISGPGYYIADCHGQYLRLLPKEAEANARLIAAAPDLLAALEEAEALIDFWHGGEALKEYHQSPEMKRIRAAIEKATG